MTAGLGRDSFVLSCLGARVCMIERSPVIGALLSDGLARAREDPHIGEMVRQRLTLQIGNSIDILSNWQDSYPDMAYLDPMYPHRTKSALVKKEMRMLRMVVGDDEDAPLLLETALTHVRERVVVKRPRLAPQIRGIQPSFAITGKKSRFDVYLVSRGA
jgi:16S rRNA (guanine1516-N2)-methyltransferase